MSCPSTCSWSATQPRSSINRVTPVFTALDSATALTTRASSSTQRLGRGAGVPLTSPVKHPSRWAPATRLSWNARTTIRSPLHPAEWSQKRLPDESHKTEHSFPSREAHTLLKFKIFIWRRTYKWLWPLPEEESRCERWSQRMILNLVSIVSVEFSLQCLKGVSVCDSWLVHFSVNNLSA